MPIGKIVPLIKIARVSPFINPVMITASKDQKKAVLDGLIELFEKNRRWLLFFGTGSSCALDAQFGMPALQKHLSAKLASDQAWSRVEDALKAGRTLEQAMNGAGVGLDATSKVRFRKAIGDFVAGVDGFWRERVLMGDAVWVGSKLLKALVGRLPPTNPRLSVVTSNYDMLIEYACSNLGVRWATGFMGGLLRYWNWEAAQDSLLQSGVSRESSRNTMFVNLMPRVELYKIHGAINRFTYKRRQIECDLWASQVPSGVERDVAVPGDLKYEQFAVNNVDTVGRAMRAEDDAQAFAMIGYGFNDAHLHRKIMERVQGQGRPLIVMTLDLEESVITGLRNDNVPVWVLVAPRKASGGNDCSHTLVYRPGVEAPLLLENERLWSCDAFSEIVLGA